MKGRIKALRKACGIGWAWEYLGLAGKPGKNVKSPFRQEKNPSFSVYLAQDGTERWYDHSISKGGDVVDFWAEAKECSIAQAIQELESIRGLGFAKPPPASYSAAKVESFAWPESFRPPQGEECARLGFLRGLPPGSFHLAGLLGTLLVGEHPRSGELLWWITDCAKCGLEGRTFDGVPCRDSSQKCTAYPGSSKGWPYGLATAKPELDALKKILLVEGGPDYFAGLSLAFDLALNFRVAAMLGGGPALSEAALQSLKGCHTLIIPHRDASGILACSKWRKQLLEAGCKVTVQPLQVRCGENDEPIKDLNDLVRINPPDLMEYLKGFES